MKKLIKFCVILIAVIFCFTSCRKHEVKEYEYTITYVLNGVLCDTLSGTIKTLTVSDGLVYYLYNGEEYNKLEIRPNTGAETWIERIPVYTGPMNVEVTGFFHRYKGTIKD